MVRLRDWYSRRNPWTRRLFGFLLAFAVVGGGLAFTPTPWYITAPGAAIDTSGLVAVQGGDAHPGKLFMLVVTTQPANLFWYLYAKLDHRADLETPKQFLGDVEDYAKYMELTRQMMADSQQTARALGEQAAGLGRGAVSDGAQITDLATGSPAVGVFQPNDVIIGLEGTPVTSAAQLRTLMLQYKPGAILKVRVRRAGKQIDLQAPTAESTDPQRKGQPVFGVYIKDALLFDVPVPVNIKAGEITGPSAGLMFTLQIVDQLTPGGITGGMVIAGTGTIEPDGTVGAIGGVKQKVYAAEAAGAKVMFVPRDNYPDAASVATRLQLVPVDRAEDALSWLHTHVPKGGA
jgi:PDZ domain-containing protein